MAEFTTTPLTSEIWDDFETVMGANGGARGCWCMHWRVPFKEFQPGAGNRNALRARAAQQPSPGLVCYLDGDAVSWVAVGDRSEYPRLQRSPVTKALDDEPVWVISCLFIRRDHRRQRLQARMISAACAFATAHDQHTVEGFPVEPTPGKTAGADNAMTGIASAFLEAGFTEVARRKNDRPAMRRTIANT